MTKTTTKDGNDGKDAGSVDRRDGNDAATAHDAKLADGKAAGSANMAADGGVKSGTADAAGATAKDKPDDTAGPDDQHDAGVGTGGLISNLELGDVSDRATLCALMAAAVVGGGWWFMPLQDDDPEVLKERFSPLMVQLGEFVTAYDDTPPEAVYRQACRLGLCAEDPDGFDSLPIPNRLAFETFLFVHERMTALLQQEEQAQKKPRNSRRGDGHMTAPNPDLTRDG